MWIELAQLAACELKGTNWSMNNVQTNVPINFRDLPVFPFDQLKTCISKLSVALTFA